MSAYSNKSCSQLVSNMVSEETHALGKAGWCLWLLQNLAEHNGIPVYQGGLPIVGFMEVGRRVLSVSSNCAFLHDIFDQSTNEPIGQ